eukprot:9480128-Pyramimonas_sp.AAC.1
MSLSFNDVRGVFLAEGGGPTSAAGPFRPAFSTIPLGLNSADCKVVTAACTRGLAQELPKCIDPIQGGFIPASILGLNIIKFGRPCP